MARDYSSRQNKPTPGKGKRKPTKRASPAARPVRQTHKRNGGAPAVVWLLCGLFIGVTVAAGFYVFGRPAGAPGHEQVSINLPNGEPGTEKPAPDTAAAAHDDQTKTGQSDAKPRFSFYKMLPNYKVEVPGQQQNTRAKPGAPHDEEPSNSTPPPVGADAPAPKRARGKPLKSAPADAGHRYVIQAGAFSRAKDAESRKARLALLGMTAQVIDIKLSSGKTIYRVQSAPIGSRSEVDELMNRLDKNQIEGLVRQADD